MSNSMRQLVEGGWFRLAGAGVTVKGVSHDTPRLAKGHRRLP